MNTKMFITDFDGVLCDSVMECLLVSHNAYHQLHSPQAPRLLDLQAIPEKQRDEFRRLRAYLKGAEDFVPIYLAIEQARSITSQQEFDAWHNTLRENLPEYTRAFYAERDYLIQHEKTLWLSLNPLFADFTQVLRERTSFDNLHILTTKRRDDVLEVFRYQKIDFPAEQITYMKAAGKSQKLIELLDKCEAAYAESVYFEDQVDFLVASKARGIGSYLVEWGYVSEEQRQIARQHDIPIISTAQYVELLGKF